MGKKMARGSRGRETLRHPLLPATGQGRGRGRETLPHPLPRPPLARGGVGGGRHSHTHFSPPLARGGVWGELHIFFMRFIFTGGQDKWCAKADT